MKVVIVNRMMAIKIGGGENFDLNLYQNLNKMGYEVELISGSNLTLSKFNSLKLPDDSLKCLRTIYLRDIAYRMESKGKSKLAMMLSYTDLIFFQIVAFLHIAINKKYKSDLIHCSGLPVLAWLLKKIYRARVVIRWPGPFPKVFQCFANIADRNLADGDAYIQLKKRNVKNLEYLGKGVDTDFYTPAAAGVGERKFVFLFVGRIVPIKNIDLIIQAVELIKQKVEFKVQIVGQKDTDEYVRLAELVKANGLEKIIEFIGFMHGKKLVDKYQHSDALLVTSHYDNSPTVVIEAMSCGLPVIATAVGGLPLMVKHDEDGVLIAPGSVDELASTMIDFVSTPEKVENYSKSARERALVEYNKSKIYKQYTRLMQ